MGVILSKFRRSKTTYEILEKLECDIKGIEAYTVSTQERQKRFVGYFLLISIVLYIIAFMVFYFVFFPPSWSERAIYSVPLLVFPFLIILLKRLVAWYFQKKLNKNSNKLNSLRAEKKKIIEKVMDKETYKVALDIINRFAEPVKPTVGTLTPRNSSSSSTPVVSKARPQSSMGQYSSPNTQPRQNQMNNIAPQTPATLSASTPTTTLTNRIRYNQQPLSIHQQQQQQQQHPLTQQFRQQITPFPIINRNERGVFEKMVDFLIGDGPNTLCAMVCRECYGHNGMASFEDYEYTPFRCAFCKALNPARKRRPVAPKLPSDPVITVASVGLERTKLVAEGEINDASELKNDSTSSSEKDSGSDTDEHDEQKPIIQSEISNTVKETVRETPAETVEPCSFDVIDAQNEPIKEEENQEPTTETKPIEEKKND